MEKIILPGRPITKKNHQQIVRNNSKNSHSKKELALSDIKNGQKISPQQYQKLISKKGKNKKRTRPYVIQSKQYREYEKRCLWELKKYNGTIFLNENVHVKSLYWMPNKRGWPDLIGLMQSTWDILEKAGIISDDKYIVNADGSRIMGIDKNNPRTEIYIEKSNYDLKIP